MRRRRGRLPYISDTVFDERLSPSLDGKRLDGDFMTAMRRVPWEADMCGTETEER